MVEVTLVNAHPRYRIAGAPIRQYVRRVLRLERKPRARISVICIDSRRCRRLNRTFLGHDYPTDVITFPLEEGLNLEGEIYVNLDKARQQAKEYRVRFTHELARLVIHGALHLAGYDDTTTGESHIMRNLEERHLGHWFGKRRVESIA
jgi:probable rRNA maturation factor